MRFDWTARQLPAWCSGALLRPGSTRVTAQSRLWGAALVFAVSAGFSYLMINGLRDPVPEPAIAGIIPQPEAPAPLPAAAFLGPELRPELGTLLDNFRVDV